MDTSKYKGLYLQEVEEHLSGIEKGLLALERDPSDTSTVDNLFRHYHSVKGMSASMGYEPLKRFAHAQEDLLDRIRSKRMAPTVALTGILLECLDGLRALVSRVAEDKPLDLDIETPITKIKKAIDGAASGGQAPPPPPQAAKTIPAAEHEIKISSIMKVEGQVFDDLLTTVGDLFMELSSFKALSHALRSIPFKDGVFRLGKTINKLHQNILSARMLPIRDLTEGLPRVVRDISLKTDKKAEIRITGDDISLDRTILENLSSPLVHIIRNCVDHGIESPDERQKASKSPVGLITVTAHTKLDKVVIKISDDGKGIDIDKVKARAASMGVPKERLNALSDAAARMLVCLPGLSAADKVTETSGRGVGMDIVKNVIESIGGSLKIDSERGKGTEITLELPRTSAIMKALMVEAGGEAFLLPISKVRKVFESHAHEISGGAVSYNGAPLPVLPLAAALGIPPLPAQRETVTIIVVEWTAPGENHAAAGEDAEHKNLAGLLVDDFGDEIDAYVKPLLPPMSKLWGASGITIMGDGRPVFLLDLAQILSKPLGNG